MTTHGVKHKFTAVLSADVKGYRRLMGEEEVAIVRSLTAYQEVMATLIQQYWGRLFYTGGSITCIPRLLQ